MKSLLKITPVFVVFFIAGVANAVMDTLIHHRSISVFRNWGGFWNPSESWRNKYKDGDPAKGPRFWGSTTIFSGFTDGWHLAKLVLLFCVHFAAAFLVAQKQKKNKFLWWAVAFIAVKALQGAGFTLFYDKLLINPKNRTKQ